MFSEYASRFLAQSQSRLSNFGQPDNNSNNGEASSRQPADGATRFSRHPVRSTYQARLGNPYHPSGSRFGFASRYNSSQDAPLFHSVLNEFQDDDDDDAREAADLRALQRSRRVFVASRIDESSASENDASRASLGASGEHDSRVYEDRGRPLGIKSSWNGESSFKEFKDRQKRKSEADDSINRGNMRHNSDSSDGKMVDIGLESTVINNTVPEDLLQETPTDTDPPAFQQFKTRPGGHNGGSGRRESKYERDSRVQRQAILEEDEPAEDAISLPTTPAPPLHNEMFKNDQFFAWIYLIAIASLFATFVLVWLHTSTPSRKNPLGDTIYTTLESSYYLLAVDTVVSIIVALVWMAMLKSFVKPMVLLIVVGTPVVLFSFSMYPMISSYQGPERGSRLQDVAMRYSAIIPGVLAIVFVWMVYRVRFQLGRAIELLEFASRLLAANPALVALGFGSLAFVVGWTWIWLWMFTRVFLGGSYSRSSLSFIINAATWWLGVFFFLMYIWTLSVAGGVVRATTGGTVSNWYFHRNKQPPAPSNAVVKEALQHATNSTFGTICAATLLQLGIRFPLLFLPSRLTYLASLFVSRLSPASMGLLTNPLCVTFAAIHSLPLMESASRLSRMQFLGLQTPTSTLTPSSFSQRNRFDDGLLPYRLARLLLNATRIAITLALGFAAWVMTARQLRGETPDGAGFRGSAYAYVVGLVAGFIGYGIMGAMEGILTGILDGVVICYGSERRLGSGHVTYCMEAAYLFGDRDDGRHMV
ncbi:uncharacterized protein BCR38DRAFT_457847 [Pseudomassariella vexata]|uniref:Protein PNS1 n=1 Tax=Pseudomassariella vexata TaxID=1141098 RepID=A0A1Y2DY75_9PEZI|nr:uncharacterized protein BCR38DRAFT_457847 [Pseudomassariella vexata]ORY64044.1 hypothetical protein BCR38DRAFT_457847 [Pseudomassariella vexata]